MPEGLLDAEYSLSKDPLLEVQHKDCHIDPLGTASHGSAWSEDLLVLVVVGDASMSAVLVLLEVWEGLR